MACGQLGLDIDYFYNLTPRQFHNIEKGINQKRDAESKERMYLTRRLMYCSLAPHSKNLKEESIWDIEAIFNPDEPLENKTETELLAEQNAMKERWAQRDAKKKAKP